MKERKSSNKSHLRNDIIFIIALILICAVGILYLFVFRSKGDMIKVTVDGELYGTYSLSQNITEDIRTGDDGSGLNRLIIKDGKAYVESASCPDGICVSHRPVFRNGESIVCLPNRVVITVITGDTSDAPDIVA
ncbi:MAG: NusG domain II-containing protein [Oscillospiraceae bacterium]|nr:NusG domain II-containing protein [Oscillospiraceae bacterium]